MEVTFMNRTFSKQSRYGFDVIEHDQMDALRKSECMCRLCSKLKPKQPDNCRTAQALCGICLTTNVAMAVTRCPDFLEK
jgi:hypothetical protein